MTDELVRAVTKDNAFRAIAVDATQMIKKVSEYHQTSELGITVLGRALIGGLLLSNALLKDDDRLALTIDGNGPAGKIVVETSAEGQVRGYVTNPEVELPLKEDGSQNVGEAVGVDGYLTVTKDMGEDMEPFTGKVQLVTGEIGDDLTYYMAKSEQIPSAVAVSVDLDESGQVIAAGGFIVSTLPDAKDEDLDKLEAKLADYPAIGDILEKQHNPMDLLDELFGADDLEEVDRTRVTPYPETSKARYAQMLETLPIDELQAMHDQDGGLQIMDRFTGKTIDFAADELANIISEMQAKQNENKDNASENEDK
ncbi:molecular chaperone Hsp33 [Weissella uvarum]|uniref:Hsp33 family molecular chaperone HslO n=1 Tax=Weissella uvarum TaxID=1479233 RepID=UPI0019617369|nr:Hsp33 family molecular chaperone HslO [Weissella uvarum]MBM7618070.1 molecular chaperone Hsp33 [Weissella uvarum]MCM0595073.1 Hsp33 family molecular chaperone HslO [Weissella uvarum]